MVVVVWFPSLKVHGQNFMTNAFAHTLPICQHPNNYDVISLQKLLDLIKIFGTVSF